MSNTLPLLEAALEKPGFCIIKTLSKMSKLKKQVKKTVRENAADSAVKAYYNKSKPNVEHPFVDTGIRKNDPDEPVKKTFTSQQVETRLIVVYKDGGVKIIEPTENNNSTVVYLYWEEMEEIRKALQAP